MNENEQVNQADVVEAVLNSDPNDAAIPYYRKMIPGDTKMSIVLKQKIIELSVALDVYLNHAPRNERYCLCNQIRLRVECLIERLAEARCASIDKRPTYIKKLIFEIEKCRMLVDLFRQKGYFSFERGIKNAFNEIDAVRRAGVVESKLTLIMKLACTWCAKPAA